jgi:sensor histidine kinase YesM
MRINPFTSEVRMAIMMVILQLLFYCLVILTIVMSFKSDRKTIIGGTKQATIRLELLELCSIDDIDELHLSTDFTPV